MATEIAAGTKVKVTMTQDGVPTVRDAEVLADMDGVVHISLDGDAVSIHPSQIVTGDTPNPAPAPENSAVVSIADVKLYADLLDDTQKRIAALTARVETLEARLTPPPEPAPAPAPAPAADPAPAPTADPAPQPVEPDSKPQTSTAAVESGEATAGS